MSSAISVFGLGYVGTISAACLAQEGHQVIGIDINPQKVEIINNGRSPVIEQEIDEIIAEGITNKNLCATTSTSEGISRSDVSLICVGTPSNQNGSLDLTFVERVVKDIGMALSEKKGYHTIILRSTVLPGTTESVVIPILEKASGKVAGCDFGVCFNPEFLREGTSVYDFYHPPFTIIGQFDSHTVDIVSRLYKNIDAPLLAVPIKIAEMIKYTNNAFHALKVTFANEIGSICKKQEIDSRQVMDIFCMDTKLNLSRYYLKPGFAFGGSCLPKDLRAIVHHGHQLDLSLPVLESIMPSNELQIRRGYEMIKRTGQKKVGVLGLSFKVGTDDLRESPLVVLIEMLLGKGFAVKIYDRNVSLARLNGANKAYIEREIPHISRLICDTVDEIINECEVIVIGNNSPEFYPAIQKLGANKSIIDLVSVNNGSASLNDTYDGICW